ncbi:MAG: LCP family protein [Firmicutes bacterium]|nr:LCP family protein [Bacillota bacterium]
MSTLPPRSQHHQHFWSFPWHWPQILIVALVAVFATAAGAAGLVFSKLNQTLGTSQHHASVGDVVGSAFAQAKPQQTFLLMGTDRASSGFGTTYLQGGRSDTLILAKLDLPTKTVTLVTIPRDTAVVLDGHGLQKINAAALLGGPTYAVQTVQRLTGVTADHYVEVDFNGFENVIDAMGGIDIRVDHALIDDRTGKTAFQPGVHHMDGKTALAYVRFRHDKDSDEGRALRQREFLEVVAQKVLSPTGLVHLPQLLDVAQQNMTTDATLSDLLPLARQIGSASALQFVQKSIPGVNAYIDQIWYFLVDVPKTQALFDALYPGPAHTVDPTLVPPQWRASAATQQEMAGPGNGEIQTNAPAAETGASVPTPPSHSNPTQPRTPATALPLVQSIPVSQQAASSPALQTGKKPIVQQVQPPLPQQVAPPPLPIPPAPAGQQSLSSP